MILSDHDICALWPDTNPGPASLDLSLGDSLLVWPSTVLRDPRRDQSGEWRTVALRAASGCWVLYPHMRYLAATAERIALPADVAGQISARSSWGRDGLSVICGPAGFCDPGYEGFPTLELSVIGSELVVWPGAVVCQIVLHRLSSAAERPYSGRYQHDTDPTPSRLFRAVGAPDTVLGRLDGSGM